MLLEGLHIPLTTPFHPDGRLNPRKLAANVVRYSKTPAAGLIVLGPSGEPTLLSDNETREVLRTAAESAAPEKVLIAGISRDSVQATSTSPATPPSRTTTPSSSASPRCSHTSASRKSSPAYACVSC